MRPFSRRAAGVYSPGMIPRPQAILFDLDGVLVRSGEAWFRTLEEAGHRFGGRAPSRTEFESTFGQGTAADVTAFGLSCSIKELDRFYTETFPRFAQGVWVDPEAKPLLETLGQRGFKLALITNTVSSLAPAILRRAEIEGAFASVCCADQVERPKPAPDLIFRALRQLGIDRSQAWMVGDSRYDRDAAQAAGVFFVGLRLPGQARIEKLSELLGLLGGAP